jgi:hypothetical protein
MKSTPFSFKNALSFALTMFLLLSLLSLMDSPSQWIDLAKKYLPYAIGMGLAYSFLLEKLTRKH